MTVSELIEKLEALQMPDARVVTPGFDESGFEDITVEVTDILFHDEIAKADSIHSGRHDCPYAVVMGGTVEGTQQAVVIDFC